MHLVGVDDPLLGDDVSELRLVRIDRPVRWPAAIGLTAPDPEVEFVPCSQGLSRACEPAGLEQGIRPRLEGPRNRSVVDPLNDERLMGNGGQVHGFSSMVACLLYTSPSPRDRTRSR